jgi:hypothetical protein
MYTDLYVNTLMQKGGLVGNLVSFKTDKAFTDLLSSSSWSLLAEETQKMWDKRDAGVRGSGKTVFSPFVEKVHKLSNPSELKGVFDDFVTRTESGTAQLLGCAPEYVGIPMTSQYQDKGMTADRIGESFDSDAQYLSDIYYGFLNRFIKEKLGCDDIIIVAGGAYKTRAVAAAQYGKYMADMGCVITVDEYRMDVLHMEPFGGELGRRLLRTVAAGIVMEDGPELMGDTIIAMKGWTNHTVDSVKVY